VRPRILIVDDDREMVKTLCDILRLHGWDTAEAYSGEEAVAAQQEFEYPCVLMDIKMPGVDGIEAFKMMRATFPELRVILMTAHSSPESMQDAMRQGAYRVVPKPLDLPALLALLE
jgi:two-component system response regulator HydG